MMGRMIGELDEALAAAAAASAESLAQLEEVHQGSPCWVEE